jgi:hypothetical protein
MSAHTAGGPWAGVGMDWSWRLWWLVVVSGGGVVLVPW